MIVTSQSDNVLSCTTGGWRVWSLSDGYIEMPADLLRDPQNNPVPQAAQAGALRLSVNCFALAGPGVDGVLIDSGGGGWAPTVGRLERTMAEAGIDPASITVLALTHTHQDHVHGLLTSDGRVLFPNLKTIVIAEAAMESFFAEAPVHIVLAARFERTFWKYRNHPKAYRAIVLEAGHVSQNLYLAATDLRLGAYVTAAINEIDIEQALGLDPLRESPIVVCGFGARTRRERTMFEFDPLGKVWAEG